MTGASIVLVSMLVVSIAGCGETAPSTAEYTAELQSTMDDLETAYGSALGASKDASKGAAVADVQLAQRGLRDAAAQLEGITPPAALEDEHDDLVAGVRDLADSVDLLIEASTVADSDPARGQELIADFARGDAFLRVSDAAARLRRAGVDVRL